MVEAISAAQIHDQQIDQGSDFKLMVVIDEHTRQCLAIHVARRIRARDAIDVFADLMETHGVPEHIRSDNGSSPMASFVCIFCAIGI